MIACKEPASEFREQKEESNDEDRRNNFDDKFLEAEARLLAGVLWLAAGRAALSDDKTGNGARDPSAPKGVFYSCYSFHPVEKVWADQCHPAKGKPADTNLKRHGAKTRDPLTLRTCIESAHQAAIELKH